MAHSFCLDFRFLDYLDFNSNLKQSPFFSVIFYSRFFSLSLAPVVCIWKIQFNIVQCCTNSYHMIHSTVGGLRDCEYLVCVCVLHSLIQLDYMLQLQCSCLINNHTNLHSPSITECKFNTHTYKSVCVTLRLVEINVLIQIVLKTVQIIESRSKRR